MAWEVLSRWSCQRHKRRAYIRRDDEDFMRSQMLRIDQNFHLGRPPASLVIGQSSTNYEHFVRFLNQYLSEMLEDIGPTDERYKLKTNFHWTSICINQQVLCKRHHDKHNEGMSAIIALGHFKGGKLRYWPEDLGAPHSPDDLLSSDAQDLRIKRKLQIFDGRRAHETTAFKGPPNHCYVVYRPVFVDRGHSVAPECRVPWIHRAHATEQTFCSSVPSWIPSSIVTFIAAADCRWESGF